jgi:two-component system cell cycle response regulator CtrA
VFVCKLRKKLATASIDEDYIHTVWGRGYVLRDPEKKKEDDKASQKKRAKASA